jgi:hypothetical protein
MSIRVRGAATLIGGICLVLIVGFLFFRAERELDRPDGWPSTVHLYRKTLSGETRVVDMQSGKTIFIYRPEYDTNIHPVKIDKINSNHWQVMFELPSQ